MIERYWTEVFLNSIGPIVEDLNAENFWDKIGESFYQAFELYKVRSWLLGFNRAVWELPEEMRSSGAVGQVFTLNGLLQRGSRYYTEEQWGSEYIRQR